MKSIFWSVTALCMVAGAAVAHDPGTPNRVVVDVQNPNAVYVFRPASYGPHYAPARQAGAEVSIDTQDRGVHVPWETSVVVYAESQQDSFLVTSSQTGCPGTEVKPSVSVAFSTARGWSDPPIRFGPLSWKTTCPLGKGVELEVCASGSSAPYVKLVEKQRTLSNR